MRPRRHIAHTGSTARRHTAGHAALIMALGAALAAPCLLTGCRTVHRDRVSTIVRPESAAAFRQWIDTEDVPVLAVFVTQGCGSCRLAGPTLSALAEEYADDLTVVEADLGLMGELISEYDLLKVPTVIIFRDGIEVSRRQGILPALFMRAFIDGALGKPAR